jgi:hypothetical protein
VVDLAAVPGQEWLQSAKAVKGGGYELFCNFYRNSCDTKIVAGKASQFVIPASRARWESFFFEKIPDKPE